MDITPIIPQGKNVIRGYGNGAFKINDAAVNGNIILLPDSLQPWAESDAKSLSIERIAALEQADIILIGCGNTHMPLPQAVYQHFAPRSIAVEIMTTGAACRTYNVLLAEGRNVAAALRAV